MAKYQLTNIGYVIKDDMWSIPPEITLQDYRDYLAWCEAGNVPEPAAAPLLPAAE